MTGSEKGIIYCRSQTATKQMAIELGCTAHHSEMSPEARDDVLQAWATGNSGRWLVATTGVGAGIHMPGIVVMLHCDRSYGIVDFVQQTGRGGRADGEKVRSIIVYSYFPQKERAGATVIEKTNNEAMRNFMLTPSCRWRILGMEMNGVAREICESIEGALHCDNCGLEEASQVSDQEDDQVSDEADETDVAIDDVGYVEIMEEYTTEVDRRAEETAGRKETTPCESQDISNDVLADHCRQQGRDANMLHNWLDDIHFGCVLCFMAKRRARYGGAAPPKNIHREKTDMCEPVEGRQYEQLRK